MKIINHHWTPINEITDKLVNYCKTYDYTNVLEIGPGSVPFPLSTKTIGINENIKDYIEIDIDNTKFPFENNSFDFVYSRHVLEDIQNPDFAMNEIIRITKLGGYIETPSPLIEITKGVDGLGCSNMYSGYIHHRYIIWSDILKNEIYFLPKYSCIIDNFLELNFDKDINELYDNPYYWNNYFIWKDRKPKIIMYKNGVNFGLNGNMINDYIKLINEAVNTSIRNTNFLWFN